MNQKSVDLLTEKLQHNRLCALLSSFLQRDTK